ncbi:hypothetical protein [Streptomyces sp. NPDC060031]|uniref:hypothetical protein n=1 Tax=Streptomyces sp. NPDC060031 TaxID=3347043 RepID=UPI00367A52DF
MPRIGRPRKLATLAMLAACGAALGGCSSTPDEAADTATASSPAVSVPASPPASAPVSASAAPTDAAAPSTGSTTGPQSAKSWPDVTAVIQQWRNRPRGVGAPDAEAIHSKSTGLLNDTESRYGSGTGSKCWPQRATSLTSACAGNAAKAAETARTSLSWIAHEDPGAFTTLRGHADKVIKAAETYASRSCANAPAAPADREACWEAGHTVAQAYDRLRDGFNAALQAR